MAAQQLDLRQALSSCMMLQAHAWLLSNADCFMCPNLIWWAMCKTYVLHDKLSFVKLLFSRRIVQGPKGQALSCADILLSKSRGLVSSSQEAALQLLQHSPVNSCSSWGQCLALIRASKLIQEKDGGPQMLMLLWLEVSSCKTICFQLSC